MKRKIIIKSLSCLLIGVIIGITSVSRVSALGSFDTISRAAQAMKTAQMRMNKILDDINFKTQYYPSPSSGKVTIPLPGEITTPAIRNDLKTFAIDSYIEHGSVHKISNEIVHKSNLPITILTWMSGYGNVSGVTIDGVQIENALVAKASYDNVDMNKRCMEFITLDESIINSLANGNHRIVVSCIGAYNSNYITYTDDFTFNLVD
ncbi:hypothetical protein NNC19_18675 [Clostridium sp. SHJSY1]|uniref:hypothetical protein n=1 Tax=Clostridium sp. SHJSY1 TaxID=2942483 RepID=UPI0028752064|nr:hypothetical protein [Clostridium sp. SHJSY1]MDS0527718.1 hypothetical protein [Clostridium sp. SHJSY1]